MRLNANVDILRDWFESDVSKETGVNKFMVGSLYIKYKWVWVSCIWEDWADCDEFVVDLCVLG